MLLRVIPGRTATAACAGTATVVLAALVAGVPIVLATEVTIGLVSALVVVAAWDYAASLRAWRRAPVTLTRRLPAAFAVDVPRDVGLGLECPGDVAWRCTLFDHADPTMTADGLPAALTLPARSRVDTVY